MKPLTPAQLAADAIDLYLEYVERHGYEPEQARAVAVSEVMEGAAVTEKEIMDAVGHRACSWCGTVGECWPCETCPDVACDECHESDAWSSEPHCCAACAEVAEGAAVTDEMLRGED